VLGTFVMQHDRRVVQQLGHAHARPSVGGDLLLEVDARITIRLQRFVVLLQLESLHGDIIGHGHQMSERRRWLSEQNGTRGFETGQRTSGIADTDLHQTGAMMHFGHPHVVFAESALSEAQHALHHLHRIGVHLKFLKHKGHCQASVSHLWHRAQEAGALARVHGDQQTVSGRLVVHAIEQRH
jgi:hypothetical protein